MRRQVSFIIFAMAILACSARVSFSEHFADSTLRVDLKFIDHYYRWHVQSDGMALWQRWAGRKVNLDSLQCHAIFEYALLDTTGDRVLFRDSKFIDLTPKPGDNTVDDFVFLPAPRSDMRLAMKCRLPGEHILLSDTIDISAQAVASLPLAKSKWPVTCIHQAADSANAVNLALLPDGYTQGELSAFDRRAKAFCDTLLSHSAFGDYGDRFNVWIVDIPSADSGVSRPSKGIVKDTAFGSQYDSFAMDRLMSLPSHRPLAQQLEGVPADYVIILANSDVYGGSGPYKTYCIGYANGEFSDLVTIHEFAHAFANLGDEYESGFENFYMPDIEPDEPNITTLHDFSGKWQNLIDSGEASLIEGAGYQPTGIWRGTPTCIMRTVAEREFCVVCRQAIARVICFLTQEAKSVSHKKC